MRQQQRPKPQSKPYKTGRGFMGALHEDAYQPLAAMRTGMQGSMAARWGGATLDFDWRHATNMYAQPLVGPRKQKAGKGRPEAPEEDAPLTGPGQPGPMTMQSHASAESSILPSDQSKSGMASDAGPATHSAALPSSPMGTALPWEPGRGPGVGRPGASERTGLPVSAVGSVFGATDSPIWPSASSTVSLGSDSSIYPGTLDKSAIGGKQDSTRRRAGMNQVALNQIGVVRRNGGWPG